VVVVLAAGFALLGGEYSIFDLRKLREDARIETDSVAVLTATVDSLTRELEAILTDPAVQERIAREKWGVLREGEFGFRIQRERLDSAPP
jgi:cell division protein FtsB